MSVEDKKLCAGTLTNSKITLYTVPAATKTIVKSVILCNKTSSAATVDLYFDGKLLLKNYTIPGYDTYVIPYIDSILEATELIEGNSDTASAVDYIICGKEVN